MNRVGKFIIFFVTAFFLSSILYSITVDFVLPKIEYVNKIKFRMAFLNYDDLLVVALKERLTDKTHTLTKTSIRKSNFLNDYQLELPYQYAPSLYFIFGESNPVDIAISNITVNGKSVDIQKIVEGFNEIGYETVVKDFVVYAHMKSSAMNGALNVHKMTDDFIHISDEELANYNEQDKYLRFTFLIALNVLVLFLLHQVLKLKYIRNYGDKSIIIYSMILYGTLFILSQLLSHKDIATGNCLENLFYIFKNYSLILLLPLMIYSCIGNQKLSYRFFAGVFVFAFLFFIGIDHFVQNVFGTRFLFGYAVKFAGNIKDGIPFLINYISTYSGIYFILMMVVVVALFGMKVQIIGCPKVGMTVLAILLTASSLAMFWGNDESKFRFLNVFQSNINGVFTSGDYKRPYVDFRPYSIEQLEYKKLDGLNLRKNVIVVLVESLGCNVTFLCGDEKNYSSYTQELAHENIWFPNYYSNTFNTNGAIFAITTGYSLVANKDSSTTPFNRELYQYDLINKFRENGYITAYFSPAPLILDKDKQLKMSDYNYISFNSDSFYDSSKKNGVFFSATDEELFAKILHDLKLSKEPVFFMTTTISTHTPYIVPWGSHSIEKAYAYSDMALKNFIKNLEDIHYFDNGIIVVTGDHVGWASNNNVDFSTVASQMDLHKVPLIVINGKDHGVVMDDVSFSHTSLGVMLEYLMLPKYYQNKYQINPLVDHNSNEYVFHYDDQKINTVNIKFGSKEDEILLDGDQTRFLGNAFSSEEKDIALGYLSWIRR